MQHIDPQTIDNPEDIFAEIELLLGGMRGMASGLSEDDFRRPDGLKPFTDQVDWLKSYYERLESLLIAEGR